MTDPKTLQDIAGKACIFDRAHFDDDSAPEPNTFLRHHETLKIDRKLITRLRPRYAVALGFFEGYTKAVEDNETVRIEYRREIEIMEKDREESERSLAEHTKQLEDEIATLVKERDDKTREWMAAQTALDNEREAHRRTSLELAAFRDAKVATIEANIGIVKRPPPPPPPAAPLVPNELSTEVDDELAQAAADYANRFGTDSQSLDAKLAREAFALPYARRIAIQDCAVFFIEGARWQAKRGVQTELDRLLKGQSMPDVSVEPMSEEQGKVWLKSIDDEAASRPQPNHTVSLPPTPIVFRDNDERAYWESMTLVLARKGDTTSQSVACAADELVEERRARMPSIGQENQSRSMVPSDELFLKAAAWANECMGFQSSHDDLQNAKSASAGSVDEWYVRVHGYIAGALRK